MPPVIPASESESEHDAGADVVPASESQPNQNMTPSQNMTSERVSQEEEDELDWKPDWNEI